MYLSLFSSVICVYSVMVPVAITKHNIMFNFSNKYFIPIIKERMLLSQMKMKSILWILKVTFTCIHASSELAGFTFPE